MRKYAKILGAPSPILTQFFYRKEPDAPPIIYHEYLMRKAEEPKSSYLTAVVLPAVLGGLATGVLTKKWEAPLLLAGASAGGSLGMILKMIDDSMIDKAQTIKNLNLPYTDPTVAEIERKIMIDEHSLPFYLKKYTYFADKGTKSSGQKNETEK